MALTPLKNNILFQFFNETRDGRFMERSKGRIYLSHSHNDYESQAKFARWGKALAVGDEVETIVPGDIILVEYGKWTTSVEHEGKPMWQTDEGHVCAIGDDESVTYSI